MWGGCNVAASQMERVYKIRGPVVYNGVVHLHPRFEIPVDPVKDDPSGTVGAVLFITNTKTNQSMSLFGINHWAWGGNAIYVWPCYRPEEYTPEMKTKIDQICQVGAEVKIVVRTQETPVVIPEGNFNRHTYWVGTRADGVVDEFRCTQSGAWEQLENKKVIKTYKEVCNNRATVVLDEDGASPVYLTHDGMYQGVRRLFGTFGTLTEQQMNALKAGRTYFIGSHKNKNHVLSFDGKSVTTSSKKRVESEAWVLEEGKDGVFFLVHKKTGQVLAIDDSGRVTTTGNRVERGWEGLLFDDAGDGVYFISRNKSPRYVLAVNDSGVITTTMNKVKLGWEGWQLDNIERKDERTILKVAVYPPLGIARIGDSRDEFYVGPEIPDQPSKGPFRDAKGRIKRQGARFRVYAHYSNGDVEELYSKNTTSIEWKVHLVNSKSAYWEFTERYEFNAILDANNDKNPHKVLRNPNIQPGLHPHQRTQLINDPGERTISGKNVSGEKYRFTGGKIFNRAGPELGEIRTDDNGRLIVLGGLGHSDTVDGTRIKSYTNNNGWFDDTADGPVGATVKIGDKVYEADPGWVLVGPPKFAPTVKSVVTLHTVFKETAIKGGLLEDDETVEFYRDIFPTFETVSKTSWVSLVAYRGHRPGGRADFLSGDWQDRLMNDAQTRKSIFAVLRPPMQSFTNPEQFPDEFSGKATIKFMPAMGGDGGNTVDLLPETWFSVTPGMYRKFAKWRDGDFVIDPHSKAKWTQYKSFDQIPAKDQPHALTLSSLEWAQGGPFEPGIEISYHCYHPEIFRSAFRFSKDFKAGDASCMMAIPWQADFYECNEVGGPWWPAARPDDVVEEKYYQEVRKANPNADIYKLLPTRVKWHRGLHENPPVTGKHEPSWGNEDMTKNWHTLGFVVPKPNPGGPILVETERLNIVRDAPPIKAPITTPIQTLDQLKAAVAGGSKVEIVTIPLYLFAMYTMPTFERCTDELTESQKNCQFVRDTIRSVVIEEMLHLALCANLTVALGGQPKFYDRSFVPSYPTTIPHHTGGLLLELQPASQDFIRDVFMPIEQPEAENAPAQTDNFQTIGQYYKAISEGLKRVHEAGKLSWTNIQTQAQLGPGEGYYPSGAFDAGNLQIVADLITAEEAIHTIIKQGHGSKEGEYADTDGEDLGDRELAHYYIFQKAMNLNPDWQQHVIKARPVPRSAPELPKTLATALDMFNATYCYALKVIEKTYTINDDQEQKRYVISGIQASMHMLSVIAARIIIQEYFEVPAGPNFEYYEFKGGSIRQQLVDLAVLAQKEWKDAGHSADDWKNIVHASARLVDL